MGKVIQGYTDSCPSCQLSKPSRQLPYGQLYPPSSAIIQRSNRSPSLLREFHLESHSYASSWLLQQYLPQHLPTVQPSPACQAGFSFRYDFFGTTPVRLPASNIIRVTDQIQDFVKADGRTDDIPRDVTVTAIYRTRSSLFKGHQAPGRRMWSDKVLVVAETRFATHADALAIEKALKQAGLPTEHVFLIENSTISGMDFGFKANDDDDEDDVTSPTAPQFHNDGLENHSYRHNNGSNTASLLNSRHVNKWT